MFRINCHFVPKALDSWAQHGQTLWLILHACTLDSFQALQAFLEESFNPSGSYVAFTALEVQDVLREVLAATAPALDERMRQLSPLDWVYFREQGEEIRVQARVQHSACTVDLELSFSVADIRREEEQENACQGMAISRASLSAKELQRIFLVTKPGELHDESNTFSILNYMHNLYAHSGDKGDDIQAEGFKTSVIQWSSSYYVAYALMMTISFAMLVETPDPRQFHEAGRTHIYWLLHWRPESEVVDACVQILYVFFAFAACYDSTWGMMLCAEWGVRDPRSLLKRVAALGPSERLVLPDGHALVGSEVLGEARKGRKVVVSPALEENI